MDFFAQPPSQPPSAAQQAFAEAIATRFDAPDSVLFTPMPAIPLAVLPPTDRHDHPTQPFSLVSSPPPPASSLSAAASPVPISPELLSQHIKPSTLILDIRPYHSHSTARIPSALPLSVPSTLIKRPNFSLQKLTIMLPSSAARKRFSAWPNFETIIVYDTDSASLPESSTMLGLLRKFQSHGFTGSLYWLKGGFQAVWREQRSLVDTSNPVIESDEDDDRKRSSRRPESPSRQDTTPTLLRGKRLPTNAFALSSTTAAASPSAFHAQPVTQPARSPRDLSKSTASNPFYDTIRQNMELEQGITERIPLRLPFRVRRRVKDLPFPWLKKIATTARPAGDSPSDTSPDDHTESSSSMSGSEDDSDPATSGDNAITASDDVSDALAMQFYRIELAEQRRLMMVMGRHTHDSIVHDNTGLFHQQVSSDFPYSITAGVEKGSKNRYRHIWPFEHARVRLRNKRKKSASGSDLDDYVNASYVQPLGTNKRYIATQGPLEATYVDFWTLCWQQNVHVIVMLTREVEGALEKCGTYWKEGSYGPLRLKLLSTSGDHSNDLGYTKESDGFFANFSLSPEKDNKDNSTIRRVFELSHACYPEAKPRKIIQLQFLGWPDMNVPEDARGVLGLVKDVDSAVAETQGDPVLASSPGTSDDEIDSKTGIWRGAMQHRPVLLHCSAGVGRTGGFIAVDAVLDGMRQEIRKDPSVASPIKASNPRDDKMDLDPVPLVPQTDRGSTSLPPAASNQALCCAHIPIRAESMDIDQLQPAGVIPNPPGMDKTRKWAENVSDSTAAAQPDPSEAVFVPSSMPGLLPSSAKPLGNRKSLSSLAAKDIPSVVEAPSSSQPRCSQSSLQVFPSLQQQLGLPTSTPMAWEPLRSKEYFPDRTRAFSAPSRGRPAMINPPRGAFDIRDRPSYVSGSPSSSEDSDPVPDASPFPSLLDQKQCVPGMAEMSFGDTSSPVLRQELSNGPGSEYFLRKAMLTASPLPLYQDALPLPPLPSSAAPTQGTRSLSPVTASTPSPSSNLSGSVSPSSSAPLSGRSALSLPPPQTIENIAACKSEYVEPRALHGLKGSEPRLLSSYDDPIWSVLLDMREQRMSLVQSLRQYVFIHAAIIEGALRIVDEERVKKERFEGGPARIAISVPKMRKPSRRPAVSSTTEASSVASSTGKRRSSPTELHQEDKAGETRLAKRPSLKRPSPPTTQNTTDIERSRVPRGKVVSLRASLGLPNHATPSVNPRPATLPK